MLTNTTVQVPASVRTESRYTCDRCGDPCGYDEPDVNGASRRVCIEREERGACHVERQTIDCCFRCFEEVVLPALAAAGFQVRTEDIGL